MAFVDSHVNIFGVDSVLSEDRGIVNAVCKQLGGATQVTDNVTINVARDESAQCYNIRSSYQDNAFNVTQLVQGIAHIDAVTNRWVLFNQTPNAILLLVRIKGIEPQLIADPPPMHTKIKLTDFRIDGWEHTSEWYLSAEIMSALQHLCLNVYRGVVSMYIDITKHWIPRLSQFGSDRLLTFDQCVGRPDLNKLVEIANMFMSNVVGRAQTWTVTVEINLKSSQVIYRLTAVRRGAVPPSPRKLSVPDKSKSSGWD